MFKILLNYLKLSNNWNFNERQWILNYVYPEFLFSILNTKWNSYTMFYLFAIMFLWSTRNFYAASQINIKWRKNWKKKDETKIKLQENKYKLDFGIGWK